MSEGALALKECSERYMKTQSKMDALHANIQGYISEASKSMEEVRKLSEVINNRAAKRAMNPNTYVPLRERFDWAKTQTIKKMQLESV